MHRICMYGKDVAALTGKTVKTGNNILNRIRELKGKEKHQVITIDEVCEYLGIDVEKVSPLIK